MCFQSQTAAVRQGFMFFSELRDFRMLHLITSTERGENVKDIVHTNECTDAFTMQTSCGDMCARVSLPMSPPCRLVVGICVHLTFKHDVNNF